MFDIATETPNPINPIPGQSVLEWLRGKLGGSPYTANEPDAEDWGGYIDVAGNGARYLIGASGESNELSGMVDWILQVHKQRTFMERLFGKNKMTRDDEFVALLANFIQAEPAMQNVSFEADEFGNSGHVPVPPGNEKTPLHTLRAQRRLGEAH